MSAGFPGVAAAAPADAKPEMHVFQDQSQHSLTAQIVAVAEPDVYLSREDDIPFRVKISVFSATDQQYIQQWAQTHVAQATLRISIAPNLASPSNGATASNMLRDYKVTISNQLGVDLTDLHIRYIIFKKVPGAPKNFSPLPRQTGAIDVAKIAASSNLTFETDRVAMPPVGLWLRVYDHDDRLLQELASSPDIITNDKWDPVDATAPQRLKVEHVGAAHPSIPANPSNNSSPAASFAKTAAVASRPAH
jgi:hypothetical protein